VKRFVLLTRNFALLCVAEAEDSPKTKEYFFIRSEYFYAELRQSLSAWLTQTKVITLKTQLHAVNAR